MKINRTREAKWAARVQRISITLSIIFGFLINCERPHGAQRHTRSPATHGLLLLTLLHAINHASHEKLREPVATDPRRSIPPPLPPVRGGKATIVLRLSRSLPRLRFIEFKSVRVAL